MAIARGRNIERQAVTVDLDTSKIVLLPNRNRHRLILRAHPDNTADVWVRFVDGDVPTPKGSAIDGAAAGAIAATDTNSGVLIPVGGSFGDDAAGQFIFDGLVTALGAAPGQNLIVLAY